MSLTGLASNSSTSFFSDEQMGRTNLPPNPTYNPKSPLKYFMKIIATHHVVQLILNGSQNDAKQANEHSNC